MIIPDKFARTVRLGVRIAKGEVRLADGRELPAIRDGAWGELVVLAESVANEEVRKTLTSERRVIFLPAKTVLWAKVREEDIPANLMKFREPRQSWPGEPGLFVAFILGQDLRIILRGCKAALLDDCNCDIPALERSVASVNHAYTALSTAFEPTRRSHTGNVFLKVFVEHEKWLRPLNDLRMQIEANPPSEPGLFL